MSKDGESRPVKRSSCQPGAVIDTEDDTLIDATLKLKRDPALEKSGLPAQSGTAVPSPIGRKQTAEA